MDLTQEVSPWVLSQSELEAWGCPTRPAGLLPELTPRERHGDRAVGCCAPRREPSRRLDRARRQLEALETYTAVRLKMV